MLDPVRGKEGFSTHARTVSLNLDPTRSLPALRPRLPTARVTGARFSGNWEQSGTMRSNRRASKPTARMVGYVLAAAVFAVLAALSTRARAAPTLPPIAACAFGSPPPGLSGVLPAAVAQAADSYASGLSGADAATRSRARQVFAAAAAAYAYGLPQVTERATVKHFVHNQIVSVAALATPQVQTVVSPNADTAYTVAWLDLLDGPIVINVPDTGGRFYTFQFLDAFTNDFAYVGSGSTGTHAGAYALVPPGWSGSLPAGVTRIDAPSSTVWLLGRTLVDHSADVPAVKRLQQQYEATPLAAWSAGERQPPVVLDQYPPTLPKSIPTGAQFIATLNNDLEIDPPPATDDCALSAMAPTGVAVPHPTPAQSLLADSTDEAPPAPTVASDPVANAAITAGTAAAAQIVTDAAATLNANSRAANNGWEILGSWVGRYGEDYIGRAIVTQSLLAANTPQQTIYPLADTDLTGAQLNGSQRYTIRVSKGHLPPVNAFWSLTLNNASFFLYPNQIDRYEIGDRTSGLQFARDGSLTVYVQHDAPAAAAQRANWLPAPAGVFHLTLRLYTPQAAALSAIWKPPPVERARALSAARLAKPSLRRLRIVPASFRPARRGPVAGRRGPARVSYRAEGAGRVTFFVLALTHRRGCRRVRERDCRRATVLVHFTRAARAGTNSFHLTGRVKGHAMRAGRYLLRAFAGGSHGIPGSAAVTVRFRVI